jgi:hypothetical protein
MLSKDLGFKSKNIVKTKLYFPPTPSPDFYRDWANLTKEEQNEKINELQINLQYIKNELAAQTSIAAFAQGDSPLNPLPTELKLKGSTEDRTTQKLLRITPQYKELFGLDVLEGRFFQQERDSELEESGNQ